MNSFDYTPEELGCQGYTVRMSCSSHTIHIGNLVQKTLKIIMMP